MRAVVSLVLTLILMSPSTSADDLVSAAMSSDERVSTAAVTALRAQWQDGVDRMVSGGKTITSPDELRRFRSALDQVCRQRDCFASQLFWHADLDQALAAARRSSKPVLSLHLLGDLGDDFSCANSRFFRTLLYSNPDIAAFMREQFVLHWKSVRPVPRVTVDFGDGRKIHRTITGNSAHYLLDAGGTPLDLLPGLYSPEAFLAGLRQFEQLARDYARVPRNEKAALLANHHLRRFRETTDELRSRAATGKLIASLPAARTPSAAVAAPIAATKMISEVSLLPAFDQIVESDAAWEELAETLIAPVVFHERTLALIAEKEGPVPEQLLPVLEKSVREDTARNEFDLHRRAHGWFAAGVAGDLTALNERVYRELFLTPSDDPWLGLTSPAVFTALDRGGVEH